MNGNIFARLMGTKRNLLALLASSAILTAGCANMATTASGVNSLTTGATLGGKVHGGNQAVFGATVNLYYAAQSIYAPAILAATTTTAADGSFSFIKNPVDGQTTTGNTYSCAAGDPVVYVVAKGGNTLGNGDTSVNNSAAAFIAVYGTCDELKASNFVDMTEVTTVATMTAVQQFFDPTTGISADGTGQQKAVVVNLVNTIALMVNAATGTAVTSTTIPASTANGSNGVVGVTVTTTPESAKINTLANIISACVNNASASATACTKLFANATPPNPALTNKPGGTTFSPATDVLQAIYYILTNPTNGSSANLLNIYNLAPSVGAPYQPSLAAAPSDWTIAISYTSSSTCAASSGNFINAPYDINIDAADDVWIANSQPGTGNLSEIAANGAAFACIFLGGGSHGGGEIDSMGNVWLATTESNNIYRYSTGIVPGGLARGILPFPTPPGVNPLGVTADGLGNVYFTASSNSSLYMIPGAASAPSAVAPIQISNVVGPNPIRLMPDNPGGSTLSNIWVASGTSYVARVTPSTSGPNLLNGYSTTTFPIGMDAYGLTVTNSSGVFISSMGPDNLVTHLVGTGTNYSAPSGWPTAAGFGGINGPAAIAIDGRENVWVPNNTTLPGFGSASEISAGAAALSPAVTGFQKTSSVLSPGRASAVDQAGNVWIAGDGPSNYLTEIVGAGVPIYQPYAKGLVPSVSRFQTIP